MKHKIAYAAFEIVVYLILAWILAVSQFAEWERARRGLTDGVLLARPTLTSGVDEHNGFARYAWSINAADGSVILEGIDVVERDDDDRLRRVVMFFGPLPQAAE